MTTTEIIDQLDNSDISNQKELIEFKFGFALAVKKGLSPSSDIATACRSRIKRFEDKINNYEKDNKQKAS